jgi:D-hydroxyproline dehydrogenase subunit alpha
VVVGGGPAGIAAAAAAAESGQEVLVVERRPHLGGNVWHAEAGGVPHPDAIPALRSLERPNVTVRTGAEVLDAPRPSTVLVGGGATAREVRYRALILATGARERLLPFPGWTLPNVTGAGGLQLLAKAGLRLEGRSVVVAGSGPLLLAAASDLRRRGAEIRSIAEQSSGWRLGRLAVGLLGSTAHRRQALEFRRELRGVPYRTGSWVVRAEGEGAVERVVLRRGRREWTERCDFLACGFHLVPNLELAELLGCRIEGGFVVVDGNQKTSVPETYAAGEPVGIGGLELARIEGRIAGWAATGAEAQAATLFAERGRLARFRAALLRAFPLDPRLRSVVTPATIVCRCEDVRADAIGSFRTGRQARLQTRCGMGRCQGRVCGPATEFLWGWSPRGARPPLSPATVSQLLAEDAPAPPTVAGQSL